MTEKEIDALYAHAGKLVAERKSLSGVFEYYNLAAKGWFIIPDGDRTIPDFNDGDEWRIAKPKKQLIDWSHPYFKGCATNYGELVRIYGGGSFSVLVPFGVINDGQTKCLRLAAPANKHSNWQPFFSTPENDTKLRDLAKMVRVEVRHWDADLSRIKMVSLGLFDYAYCKNEHLTNYRITGLQDGWTDNSEEAQA